MSCAVAKTGTSAYQNYTSESQTWGPLGKDNFQSDLPAHDAVYNNG